MNIIKEKEFLNNFICKAKKDRIIYKLQSKNKRINAIDRFSHNLENLIEKSTIIVNKKDINKKEFYDFFKDDCVYVLSFKYLDGLE